MIEMIFSESWAKMTFYPSYRFDSVIYESLFLAVEQALLVWEYLSHQHLIGMVEKLGIFQQGLLIDFDCALVQSQIHRHLLIELPL